MDKIELVLKTRKTKNHTIYDGIKEYEEVVDMKCVTCNYQEAIDADIVFECWEMNGGPFPIFTGPHCNHETFIPLQVIKETEEAEKKENTPR